MEKFLVTFGGTGRGKVEILEAKDRREAVKKVKEKYGKDWDAVYTEEEYKVRFPEGNK